MNAFLHRKKVDWSLLNQGMTISVEFQPLWWDQLGCKLQHGEATDITILLDNLVFKARLQSIDFDQERHPNHPDLVQVRYSPQSEIAKHLRQVFETTHDYVTIARQDPAQHGRPVVIPDDILEYVAIYGTDTPGVFGMECFTAAENAEILSEISSVSEYQFEEQEESFAPIKDTSAGFTTSKSYQKVRKLNRSIGETLKKLYDYRCQMTGERVGDGYDCKVVEAHHIDPFTKSVNNDTSNIIILSPNYHRIIHKANPIFDRSKKAFIYPNGLEEKVKIDKHLAI